MRWLYVALAAAAAAYVPRHATFKRPALRRASPRLTPVAVLAAEPQAQTLLPSHPEFVRGRLPNGLEYVILPNASPAGRFEAHLEVFAGSADENDDQQGMAHLVEHVAYMGSRKRERLFGTGSQTNAYTDFHHTVFYACCPREAPGGGDGGLGGLLGNRGGASMLPRALDALCEVLQAQFAPARVEKERAAVLSEMSMVNTIEYRVECRAGQESEIPNFKGSYLGHFPLVLANSWTSDHLSERSRSVDAFFGTRARGTLTLKRR